MPGEDDFDIYGEDDGFHVKADEVRLPFFFSGGTCLLRHLAKSIGYDDVVNQDAAEAATHSPVVGEKRPREDDENEETQEQQPSGNGVKEESQEPQPVPSSMRSPNSGSTGSYPMGLPGNGTPTPGQTFDALYIGDLQWVCVYCRLVSHVHTVLRRCRLYCSLTVDYR